MCCLAAWSSNRLKLLSQYFANNLFFNASTTTLILNGRDRERRAERETDTERNETYWHKRVEQKELFDELICVWMCFPQGIMLLKLWTLLLPHALIICQMYISEGAPFRWEKSTQTFGLYLYSSVVVSYWHLTAVHWWLQIVCWNRQPTKLMFIIIIIIIN